MRLQSALLLSAGAHLAGFSVAASLQGPAAPGGAEHERPPLRAALVAALDEPRPRAAQRVQQRVPAEAAPAKRRLPLAELDVRPQIKTHVMPQYPEGVPQGTRGRVVLELRIAADGSVEAINVERAEPGGVFEEAAVKAFSKAQFAPGMKRGLPVPTLLRVEVSFGDWSGAP